MKAPIFEGIKLLLMSPSGVFGLLTLFAITYCTVKVPAVGSYAFAAFVAVVPAILCLAEHREQMAAINMPQPQQNWSSNNTTPDIDNNSLPKRGQL